MAKCSANSSGCFDAEIERFIECDGLGNANCIMKFKSFFLIECLQEFPQAVATGHNVKIFK